MSSMSGDSHLASIVIDHPYEARDPTNPWGFCKHCDLSEAAHRDTVVPYDTSLEYRCPRCVDLGTSVCCHSPEQIDAFIKGEGHSPEEPVGNA